MKDRQIPIEDILSATANGVGFFNDLNLFTIPALLWAYLPGEDRDLILGVTGNLWSHIAVKREEMKRLALVMRRLADALLLEPVCMLAIASCPGHSR